ncbi:hypothetical protein VSDG_09672 [Cytospora chrysosperma]|uniref:Uncharacterized protein n=1 Tax=Cytospora chrysosperma TaxID=252740 RepID=A0A423V9A2_CYTCH|nr:hypothetical protein VSDG_09672 [Valsa sordida]
MAPDELGLSTPMLWTDDEALSCLIQHDSAEMPRAIMRAWLRMASLARESSNPRPELNPVPPQITSCSRVPASPPSRHGTYASSVFALRALADALVMDTLLYPRI